MHTVKVPFAFIVAIFIGSSAVAASPNDDRCLNKIFRNATPGELETIITACTKALAQPGLNNKRLGALYRQRGMAHRFNNSLQDSLNDLKISVAKDPRSAFNRRMLGWTLRVMNRLDDAVAVYDQAIAMEREYQGYLSRCNIFIAQGKLALARSDCETSLAFDRNPDSLFMTPLIYARLGKDKAAIPLLEEAIARSDSEARAYILLACIYARQNQIALSRKVRQAGINKFHAEYERMERINFCDTIQVPQA